MPRPALELADIFRQHGPAYRQSHSLPLHQHRLMQAIETCRTPALGGSSAEWCGHCQYSHIRHRSCRNRHCPKCQRLGARPMASEAYRRVTPSRILSCSSPCLRIACRFSYNKEAFADLLFRTAAETLLTIAHDPKHLGAEIGFFAVLHTWGPKSALASPSALRGSRWRTPLPTSAGWHAGRAFFPYAY